MAGEHGPVLEQVRDGGTLLAIVLSAEYSASETEFLTPESAVQQVGLVVREAGSVIDPHHHPPVRRSVEGTPETLVVRSGRMRVTIFSPTRAPVAVRELREGDAIVLIAGGHGFEMLEDTVLLEAKQGPYVGDDDKERF